MTISSEAPLAQTVYDRCLLAGLPLAKISIETSNTSSNGIARIEFRAANTNVGGVALRAIANVLQSRAEAETNITRTERSVAAAAEPAQLVDANDNVIGVVTRALVSEDLVHEFMNCSMVQLEQDTVIAA